jgi:hypothetical protein
VRFQSRLVLSAPGRGWAGPEAPGRGSPRPKTSRRSGTKFLGLLSPTAVEAVSGPLGENGVRAVLELPHRQPGVSSHPKREIAPSSDFPGTKPCSGCGRGKKRCERGERSPSGRRPLGDSTRSSTPKHGNVRERSLRRARGLPVARVDAPQPGTICWPVGCSDARAVRR